MSERYSLYGADFSLYTGKVRSYLQKKGIPFDEVLATVAVYKKFIVPRTGVSFIPVVQTPDDTVLQDTTVIIDELERRFPSDSVYPATPKQKLLSLLLETYGDEWLVIPAMHYRWAYQEVNQPFIYEKFGSVVAPWAPKIVRAWLGKKLGSRFKGAVPLLGVSTENEKAIEASYTLLLADLNEHFSQHDYLFGSRPSVADYGFIGPLYAHLYHDPYPGELMRRTAPAVARWVERMTDGSVAEGEFLANDHIPDTLLPILQRMVSEQLPVLLDTDRLLDKWHKANPDTKIPRSIGKHEFTVEGVTGRRIVVPYSLWMLQRSVDYYQTLDASQQTDLNKLLDDSACAALFKVGLQNKLVRVNNRLEFAD